MDNNNIYGIKKANIKAKKAKSISEEKAKEREGKWKKENKYAAYIMKAIWQQVWKENLMK